MVPVDKLKRRSEMNDNSTSFRISNLDANPNQMGHEIKSHSCEITDV